MIVEGPLGLAQLLETTIINLVSFPSLIATNARRFGIPNSRMKMIAGRDVQLSEFGLRRAQGPDGGLSASQYSYLGGFDSTSNVLCGKTYGVTVNGTMAHSFVTSFTSLEEVKDLTLLNVNLLKRTLEFKEKLGVVSFFYIVYEYS